MAKILIVEDEPDVAELIRMLVEEKGHDAEIALGGKEGLKRIRKDKRYDLVLLDIRMPEVTGRDILETAHLSAKKGRLEPRYELLSNWQGNIALQQC